MALEETRTMTTPWGRSVDVTYRKGRNDYNVLHACICEDEYHIARIGRPGAVMIDIGAHIGGASVAAVAFGMSVVAVEVLPENAELLRRNLLSAGLSAEHVVNKAIHHTAGRELTMLTGPVDTESGHHHEFIGQTLREEDSASEYEAPRARVAPTTSVAELMGSVDHCRILKIDAEGAEWECFKNVPDELLNRIDYVVGEVHVMARHPPGTTPLDFFALFNGKFDDVSADFGEIGFARAAETGVGLCNFVLRRKSVVEDA